MYSFEPNEEQKMLIDTVSKYAVNDLRAAGAGRGGKPRIAEETRRQRLGTWPVCRHPSPRHMADLASAPRSQACWLAKSWPLAIWLARWLSVTPNLFALPILLGGTEEQKQEYLPKVIEGNWAPYTSALIEYSFDFDPAGLKTMATARAIEYIFNGEKAYVPFAKEAEAMIVYAASGWRHAGIHRPERRNGMTISDEREKLMSLNALPMYRVKLDGVKVPQANRSGGDSGLDFEPVLASMRVANCRGRGRGGECRVRVFS